MSYLEKRDNVSPIPTLDKNQTCLLPATGQVDSPGSVSLRYMCSRPSGPVTSPVGLRAQGTTPARDAVPLATQSNKVPGL